MPERELEEVPGISTKMATNKTLTGVRDVAAVSASRHLPAAQPLEKPPFPLGRPARSTRPIDRWSRGERLGGRRRSQVLVEELSPKRGTPALCQRQHFDDLFSSGKRDPKRIARTDQFGGLGRAAVDIHLPALACRSGEASSLEEARGPEPLIHPDAIHRSLLPEPLDGRNSLPPGERSTPRPAHRRRLCSFGKEGSRL